ncbi:MAG: hypothetical protein K9J12_02915 [Melioribacteraceae bacterium]|nr:hypothetical protein [Melioribacteraceae bacterium]MCF8263330.1 hypothetical protein [Melioribacteraceae bacterium]MCF8414319.1 hypothetical protein [Melioribacteraceae bacterium]
MKKTSIGNIADQKETNAKNLKAFIIGGITAFIVAFFVNELFQYLIALIFGAEDVRLGFSNYNFHVFFNLPPDLHIFIAMFISFASIFICIIFLRLGTFIMIRSDLGLQRFYAIGFQLILSGYLLISVFYGAFVVLLNAPMENDWLRIVNLMGLKNIWRMVFMFGGIIMISFYLHILSYKLKIYINAHNK